MGFNSKRFAENAEKFCSANRDLGWDDSYLIEAISKALEIELGSEVNNSGTEKPQQQKD